MTPDAPTPPIEPPGPTARHIVRWEVADNGVIVVQDNRGDLWVSTHGPGWELLPPLPDAGNA